MSYNPNVSFNVYQTEFVEQMEQYTIEWRGPFSWDEVVNQEGYYGEERLYAIAYEPPVRKGKTLYIGKATKQRIGKRLYRSSADISIADDYGERSIVYYLGEVILGDNQRRSERRTLDVEAALINCHAEMLEYNIQSAAFYYGRDLKIRQRGNVPPGIESFDTSDW